MGTVHYYTAIAALIFGTWVISARKGNQRHKKIGLLYVISMSVMLSSSLMSYRLDGTFNLFHYASVISYLTLAAGMFPAWLKKPQRSYIMLHVYFMYWSLIGLYMGFFAEIFTRVSDTPFYSMVALSSGSVFLVGLIVFKYKIPHWEKAFGKRGRVNSAA